MTGELSGILEHVDRIGKLDLEGVEPTTHVVALENVLRADEPRPSLPPEVALAPAPEPGRRRLPRSLAAGRRLMAGLLDLTVAEAAAKIAAGELSAAEYFAAWRGAAAGDELNAYLWQVEDPAELRGRGGPAERHPGRGQGHLLHRGRADHGRLADPRGLPAALHGDRRAAPRRRRRPRARQDQHGRVRDGLLERELGLRAGAEPVGPRPRARRLLGRLGGGRRRRPRALRDRHRHRRLDPPARLALRDRRPQAHLRRDLALRDDRLRLLARPVRAADPRRHRRGAAAGGAAGPRPLRLDLGRDRGRRSSRPAART